MNYCLLLFYWDVRRYLIVSYNKLGFEVKKNICIKYLIIITCELSGVSWKKVSGSLCLWTGAFSAFSLKYIFSISNLLIVNHGRSTAFQNSLLWLKHFFCMFSTLSLHPLSLITDNSSDKRAFLWWLVAVSKQA